MERDRRSNQVGYIQDKEDSLIILETNFETCDEILRELVMDSSSENLREVYRLTQKALTLLGKIECKQK